MKLRDVQDEIEALGLNVAAITYDPVDKQRAFLAETGMDLTLLRDENARHVNAWGIRNEQYGQGHRAYGIPHPGIVWIGPDGRIRAKWAEPGYRQRPAWADVVRDIRAAIDDGG